MSNEVSYRELIRLALSAAANSYAPYSGFAVGAALLSRSGKAYLGCNIENSAYTPTVCAERTAFYKAISEGERSFSAIAIVGGRGRRFDTFCPPCGVCRQVMAEFCNGDFEIILGRSGDFKVYTLRDLFPEAFGSIK